jgi:hypothetical protein
MPELQTSRSPTLLTLPLSIRRKGQGPKAKPADEIQEFGYRLCARKGVLPVLETGTWKSMLPVLETGIWKSMLSVLETGIW